MKNVAPKFYPRKPKSKITSLTASAIRKSNTYPEVVLVRSLQRLGIRVRPITRKLPGHPDLVFPRKKLIVFCDGDFWHGRNWRERKESLKNGANADYWISKITYNRRRDRKNNKLLCAMGWRVVRLWESDIRKNHSSAVAKVMKIYRFSSRE